METVLSVKIYWKIFGWKGGAKNYESNLFNEVYWNKS